ncbi:hypothetical protein HZA41_02620 [Candidatus Peregrinibacteria bacterium]|nr:hypothetical protein [Candidatus Peregrinibacteria bacterium]
MPKDSITISEALQKIHEWMDEKNYEKAIQGCQEILQIDAENAEVKEILKNAETLKKNMDTTEKIILDDPLPSPEPQEVKFPEITSESENSDITFSKTKNPTWPADDIPMEHEATTKHFTLYLIKKIATILIIFTVVSAMGYGGFLAYSSYKTGGIHFDTIISKINIFSSKKTEPTEKPAPTTEPEKTTKPPDKPIATENDPINLRNATRTKELQNLQTALEAYYTENSQYPAASDIEKDLIEEKYMTEIPIDPRHNEIDETEQTFGYVYAVYDTPAGEKQFFILSALFENPIGENMPWSPGETEAREDYRDLKKEYVKLLSPYTPSIEVPPVTEPPKHEKVRRIL